MGETIPLFAGRYRLGPLLGEGAAARTYRAVDVVRDGPVALKVVRDRELEATLLTELEVLGRLVHPHLAPLYDLGRVEEGAYCATQWIDGRELGGVSGWSDACPALVDVLDALAALHRAGVRHGDVKPANILVEHGVGRGWLIDLGCAAKLGVARGSVFGTPGYLAPELLRAEPADARADLYAFAQTVSRLEASWGPPPAPWTEVASCCARDDPAARPGSAAEVLELLGHAERARSNRSPDSLRLVGRDEELTRLRRALGAWSEGQPGTRVAVIAGRTGSGRSRLLSAIKREAQRHHRVVEASARQDAPLSRLLTGAGSALQRPGIEGALEALHTITTPVVWVIDDVPALAPADRRTLRALVSTLSTRAPLFVCMVDGEGQASSLASLEGDAIERVTLAGLTREAVAAWCGDRLDETAVARLFERSDGHPETVRWMLGGAEPEVESRLRQLSPEARLALVEVAASGARSLTSIEASAWMALSAAGWVKLEAGLVRLAQPAYQDVIEASLEPEPRRTMHEGLARSCSHPADRLRHRALAGLPLSELPSEPGADPRWRRAAAALARSEDPSTRRVGARYLLHLGEARHAIEALADLVERDDEDHEAKRLLARAHLSLEETERVLALLAPLEERRDPEALDLAARAHIKRGEYQAAVACVGRAPEGAEPRAALLEDLGVAKSYLSEPDATSHLRAAEALLANSGSARDRVRVASYLAIDAFRRGELEQAREGYAAALALVVAHGLDDQLAPAALNLGTVAHQTGDWGTAYRAYRRGHAVARALGQRATLATLELDDAQLYADVGAFARARAAAERASELAEAGGYGLLAGAAAGVRVQVALLQGDVQAARRALELANMHFDEAGATRERDETWLYARELAHLAGEPAPPKRSGNWPADLEVRAWLTEGRIEGSVPALEQARAAASRRGLMAEVAEADGELARLWAERGAHALAERHRRDAQERWERCAVGLPEALRDDFWRHPRRTVPRVVESGTDSRAERLTRLLSINRALGSTLEVDAVLHQAMDAAVELTGAERGFLVLVEDGGMEVPVARNLAREEVGKAHLEFSRSIAEQAIVSGEAVTTDEARQDARFRAHRSVPAM
ncbi:MAG: AAA family ATPase, partial [Sandaracinaceae bacterium]